MVGCLDKSNPSEGNIVRNNTVQSPAGQLHCRIRGKDNIIENNIVRDTVLSEEV